MRREAPSVPLSFFNASAPWILPSTLDPVMPSVEVLPLSFFKAAPEFIGTYSYPCLFPYPYP
jgi:hypothetical protein